MGSNRNRVWPAVLAALLVIVGVAFIFVGPGPPPEPQSIPVALVSTSAPTTTTTAGYVLSDAEPRSVLPGWTALDPGPLAARTGSAMVWTGDELFIWGGGTQGGAYGDGAAYRPDLDAWRRISEAPIGGSADVTAVWTGAEVLVFTTTESAAYDPAGDSWRVIARRPLEARHPIGAVWTGAEAVLVTHIQTQPRLLDQLVTVVYDPNGDSWRTAPDAPAALSYASVMWTRHEVVLVGGHLDGDNRPRSVDGLASAIAYNPVAGTWRTVDGIALPPYAVTAAWTGRQIVAWDYELDARTTWLAGAWQTAPRVPLRFSECYPESEATEGAVLGWYCGQSAVYEIALPEGIATWTRIESPPNFDPEVFVPAGPVWIGDDRVAFWGGDWDGTGGPFFFELDMAVAVAAARGAGE